VPDSGAGSMPDVNAAATVPAGRVNISEVCSLLLYLNFDLSNSKCYCIE